MSFTNQSHLGIIAITSIFLALYAALSTAYILYSIDWEPWNKLKRLLGNRILFMAICFSIVLIVIGFLLNIFLFRMTWGLIGYSLVCTATLIFLQLSHWKAASWLSFRHSLGSFDVILIGIASLALSMLIMYTILYLLLSQAG